jgi:hypothetical protein
MYTIKTKLITLAANRLSEQLLFDAEKFPVLFYGFPSGLPPLDNGGLRGVSGSHGLFNLPCFHCQKRAPLIILKSS